MLIDFHVHLAGTGCCHSGVILSKTFEKRPTFFLLKKFQKITKEQMQTDIDLLWIKRIVYLVEESKKISKATALCLDSIYDESGKEIPELIQMFIPNSWGLQAVKQFPTALLHGASVHPYRKDAIQELENCHKNNAFLIKWLPSMMGIDPEHELCVPFYEALKHYKIPLLSHTDNEHTFAEPKSGWMNYNHILKLKKALDIGVVVIAAHAGTPTQMHFAEELAEKYENFYLDTSGLFNPNRARASIKLFESAQKSILGERLLFATDWPVPSLPLFLIDKIGISSYKEISAIRNPFLKDLLIKEKLGFHFERFKKNQETLLTLIGRSHTEVNLT